MASHLRKLRRAATSLAVCLVAALAGALPVRADEPPDGTRSAAADRGGSDGEELQRLRSRVAALEQAVARARDDAQAELLRELNSQIAALRADLSQAQASAAAAQVALQQQREQLQRSVVALVAVRDRLASGDSGVIDDLDAAAPALPLPAQEMVQSARAALEREDLATARYTLGLAIAIAQLTQLAR
jgi:DNA repair exonuclease SbcCD ATPase subunit